MSSEAGIVLNIWKLIRCTPEKGSSQSSADLPCLRDSIVVLGCCFGFFFFCCADSLSLGDNRALEDDRIDLYVCFMSLGLCDTLYKCRPQQLMVMLAASITNPACLWHKVCTVLWKCQIRQSHLFCKEFLSPLISKTK